MMAATAASFMLGAAAAAHDDDDDNVATTALVAYLRSEADLSDQKAASLRAQAQTLSMQYGVTQELQQQYAIDPDELPPLNEQGIPKYRGKKRGRKANVRKRKINPNRRKRQHTAYTLFVQENYDDIKAQLHVDRPSKVVIAAVAKAWATIPAEQKKVWKERAQQTHESGDEDDNGVDDNDDEDNDEEDEEDEDEVEEPSVEEQAAEDEDDAYDEAATAAAAPPARPRRRRGTTASQVETKTGTT